MIRRSLAAAAVLVALGGVGAQALADSTLQNGEGTHGVCLLASDGPNGAREGICVWVPTK
jgi:hypothetical protein